MWKNKIEGKQNKITGKKEKGGYCGKVQKGLLGQGGGLSVRQGNLNL